MAFRRNFQKEFASQHGRLEVLIERFLVNPREKGRETKMVIMIIRVTQTVIIADAYRARLCAGYLPSVQYLLVLRPLLQVEHQNGEVNRGPGIPQWSRERTWPGGHSAHLIS